MFVIDFADDLFEQIFYCNQSGSATVLINDHGHIDLLFLHLA